MKLIRNFKRRLLTACLALGAAMAAPSLVSAQEVDVETDARLEGYGGQVKIEKDSTALIWLLFIVLSIISLGALFKDAKRTHLD